MMKFPCTYVAAFAMDDFDSLRRFCNHSDPFVRTSVLSNPNLPFCLLLEALYHDDPVVCAGALGRLRTLCRRDAESFANVLVHVRKRKLEGGRKDWCLRATLAGMAEDADWLRELFDSGEWSVHLALANNRHCPQDILKLLSELPVVPSERLPDKNREIREAAKVRLGLIKSEAEEKADNEGAP